MKAIMVIGTVFFVLVFLVLEFLFARWVVNNLSHGWVHALAIFGVMTIVGGIFNFSIKLGR